MKQIIISFFIVYNFLYAIEGTATSADKIGYISDSSRIKGIDYRCEGTNSYNYTTGDNGSFIIKSTCSDAKIIFSINEKVKLGEISFSKLQEKNYIIYTTDLMGQTNVTNEINITNISRVLQTLDSDLNPYNNIEIDETIRNNINNTIDLSFANEEDLNNTIIDAGYSNRKVISKICSLVHLEHNLRLNGIEVDTVPPCQPQLAYDINATANNQTFIELIGEQNSKIFLNGIDTNLTINSEGRYLEFKLDTQIRSNNFHEFNLTFVDDKNQISLVKTLKIFNDTDQPVINNDFSVPVSLPLDLNITDSSLNNNIFINYEVNNTLFDINSTGTLTNKSAPSGTYIVKVKVTDQVLHSIDSNVTITVP